MRSLLGIAPPASLAPAHATVGERLPWRSAWRQRVVLTAPAGHEIPCYYLTPSTSPPWRGAVIAVHQHNGEFELGKSEVIGQAGNPDIAYALELAEAGIPVLAPDLSGFEERRADPLDPARAEQLTAWALITEGKTLQGRHTEDIAVATTWLLGQGIAGPLGVIGHSLGGQVALFSLACDERIEFGVISCGIGTLESFATHAILHNPAWYVPGLRAAGDTHVVVGAIEHQRVRVLAGRSDPIFPFAEVGELVSSFPPDVCDFIPFDGAHSFPSELRVDALAWLADRLRRPADRG